MTNIIKNKTIKSSPPTDKNTEFKRKILRRIKKSAGKFDFYGGDSVRYQRLVRS